MHWFGWVMIGVFVLFIGVLIAGSGPESPEREAHRKQECAAAITSSIGYSTTGYADKVAYDKVVREKCDGLTINGKPLGK